MIYDSKYGKIFYEIQGTGRPVIFIHGTPFSSKIWKFFADVLDYKYRVYVYDLLGYGQSEKVNTDVSLGIQNLILDELLDHWHLENPIAIAHDFGGATLLRNIIQNKRTYQKILLMDIVALSPWGSPFVQHVKYHEEVFNRIPDYIHEAMLEKYIRDASYHNLSEKEIKPLLQPWLGQDGKEAFYRQIAQMDQKYTDEIEHEISKIDIPVKILWGESDNWIPMAKGKQLHELIKGSVFKTASHAGHLIQLDRPEFVLREILSFLET